MQQRKKTSSPFKIISLVYIAIMIISSISSKAYVPLMISPVILAVFLFIRGSALSAARRQRAENEQDSRPNHFPSRPGGARPPAPMTPPPGNIRREAAPGSRSPSPQPGFASSSEKEFEARYYAAKAQGKDLDPWDIPEEKAPWEM